MVILQMTRPLRERMTIARRLSRNNVVRRRARLTILKPPDVPSPSDSVMPRPDPGGAKGEG